ncbi:site-specific integrase [Mycobacterium paraintracellulare]|uniref:site-specific integrase n=1 Tax=Mycobacterium paraintracellulare TaxID=1138383 RepID=UPI0019290EEF|nr:site-specific integrase [Mycobacterium paraintracellulare]BCP05625.1 site-specific integrase [Mycobacterium paraintracellulare]
MATVSKYLNTNGETLYRVRYRTPENKQTDKRGFTTKRDANAFAATVEVKKMTGEYIAPSLGKVTIGLLGPAWLERQRGHMKPSGFRSYESAWRNHVQPRWSDVQLSNVKYSDVQAWVTLLSTKLSASMIANTYSVLARILDDAVKDRLIPSNPSRGVKLPKRTKRPNVYLTREQLSQLADESGRYRSLVLLLGTVGLRWGEAAALRVSDVDFLRRRITVHRNAVTVGKEVIVGSLKTGHNRVVPLAGFAAEALATTCEGKNHNDLIWPSRAGSYLSPPAGNKSWLSGAVDRCVADAIEKRAAEHKSHPKQDPITKVFPRITAHDLRHTAASLAISAGANVLVVQRMLGHASAAMTLDTYADLFDNDLDAVAESVGKMWADGGQKPKVIG